MSLSDSSPAVHSVDPGTVRSLPTEDDGVSDSPSYGSMSSLSPNVPQCHVQADERAEKVRRTAVAVDQQPADDEEPSSSSLFQNIMGSGKRRRSPSLGTQTESESTSGAHPKRHHQNPSSTNSDPPPEPVLTTSSSSMGSRLAPGAAKGLSPQSVIEYEGLWRLRGSPRNGQGGPGATGRNAIVDATGMKPHLLDDLSSRQAWVAAGGKVPEILEILDFDTVRALFDSYFKNLHPHFPILCPKLHRAETVVLRSQLLLTVCASTASFMSPGTTTTNRLKALATSLCFTIVGSGAKSVEIIQACLILTCWPLPITGRAREDNTWVIMGLASTLAREMGLRKAYLNRVAQRSPLTPEDQNWMRTWLHCHMRQQGLAVQIGRATVWSTQPDVPSVQKSDGTSDDLGAALHSLAHLFFETNESFLVAEENCDNRSHVDFSVLTAHFDSQLLLWRERFNLAQSSSFPRHKDPSEQASAKFQRARVNFMAHYISLCIHSHGLKHALEFRPMDTGIFFKPCYTSATALLRAIKQDYAPSGVLLYAPDSIFVSISYAAISLLRFCQPPLGNLHNHTATIHALLDSIVVVLKTTTPLPNHPASQYAIFLQNTINAQKPSSSTASRSNGERVAHGGARLTPAFSLAGEEAQFRGFDQTLSPPHIPSAAAGGVYSESFWDGVLGYDLPADFSIGDWKL